VIGPVHDESNATCQGAELADDEPVADERIVIKDVLRLEPLGAGGVVVVGVMADDDVRVTDEGLEKGRPGESSAAGANRRGKVRSCVSLLSSSCHEWRCKFTDVIGARIVGRGPKFNVR